MNADYYYEVLEDIDGRAQEVTGGEAEFIESLLKNRPAVLSPKQVDWIRRLARKYLGEEIE